MEQALMEYYKENDPRRRKELLAQLPEDADDGCAELRRTLFNLRYREMKQPPYLADNFLGQILNLQQMVRMRLNTPRGQEKVRKALDQMGAKEAAPYGEAGQDVLLEEYKHALKLYYKCQDEEGFRLFGIVKAPESYRRSAMIDNALNMSRVIIEHSGLREEMALWDRAVREVLGSFGTDWLEEYDTRKIR